jgi:hypothetical protein
MRDGAELRDLVAVELSGPVDPRVTAVAEAIAARHRPSSRAVLFYGSCLRERQLEGRMLDFYLIVSDYRTAYDKRWLATANRLIPPNVFYFEKDGLAAKYAVLSEADFAQECDASARTPSVFARFSQPSRLVWAVDEEARSRSISAVARAVPTLLGFTRPTLSDGKADPLQLWKEAFRLTYGAELRAERDSRPEAIVDSDADRYCRFAKAAGFPDNRSFTEAQRRTSEDAWRQFQRRGKRASVLRLIKASFTFAGGAEYIAWKINRHAGTRIELKPWQRRHPLLAGISLLPRLLRSGAIR